MQTILVYADWYQFSEPKLVGELHHDFVRAKSVYSFEYDADWIKQGISIDPDLPLLSGFHHAKDESNFGIFQDSSPDRWGQMLMKRREVLLAKEQQRQPRALQAIDFLLGVHDRHRMGALRFKLHHENEFLSHDEKLAAPPWASLRELAFAVEQYEQNAGNLNEQTLHWINQLIAPGSSLGGARPKADVIDNHGHQWIAKFPSQRDDYDSGLWEMIVHDLAVKAGITVPQATINKFDKSYHTFLSKRFDRLNEGRRVHYASAMTMLQCKDGDDAGLGLSYLDIVSFIKSHCTDVSANLEELFRRVLFSVCVSNTDDHLRNHGFLYSNNGWMLSPAFDINANEYGNGLKLNIDEDNNLQDIDLVMSTAPHYLLSIKQAKSIKTEVVQAVESWYQIAQKHKANKFEIELKAKAFRV